jgi:hypothetical protein
VPNAKRVAGRAETVRIIRLVGRRKKRRNPLTPPAQIAHPLSAGDTSIDVRRELLVAFRLIVDQADQCGIAGVAVGFQRHRLFLIDFPCRP